MPSSPAPRDAAPTPLEPGRFYGVNHSERDLGGLLLSETVYQPDQIVPPHLHQRAYLAYLVGGGYREQLGRRGASTFHARSLVFHPPREVQHGDISERGARMFHLELPDAWIDRVREHGALPELALDRDRGPLIALARTAYREFRRPDAASPLVIEGVVLELLGGLLRMRTMTGAGGVGRRPLRVGPRTPWLARARELLRARALSAPRLADIAAEVGVPPTRLARAFRRVHGESPGDYLRRERIRIACDRLTAGGAALAALAAELGFVDQSHFTRAFRAHTGVTPGGWQRDHARRR